MQNHDMNSLLYVMYDTKVACGWLYKFFFLSKLDEHSGIHKRGSKRVCTFHFWLTFIYFCGNKSCVIRELNDAVECLGSRIN